MSLIEADFEFLQDSHAYLVKGGRQVMSVTQIIHFAGLVSYAGIPPAILAHAAWRGTLVHEACAWIDKGVDVYSAFDLPPEILPYCQAYSDFVEEFDFVADQDEIERPRVVTVRGIEFATTPDSIGRIRGNIPAIIERKCTAAAHPCWGIQLAGQEASAKRPAGFRNYQRIAVQLKRDATFKPHYFEDPSDFDMFAHSHSVAAWKLNHKLVKFAA
jgi:hypothetical protein